MKIVLVNGAYIVDKDTGRKLGSLFISSSDIIIFRKNPLLEGDLSKEEFDEVSKILEEVNCE